VLLFPRYVIEGSEFHNKHSKKIFKHERPIFLHPHFRTKHFSVESQIPLDSIMKIYKDRNIFAEESINYYHETPFHQQIFISDSDANIFEIFQVNELLLQDSFINRYKTPVVYMGCTVAAHRLNNYGFQFIQMNDSSCIKSSKLYYDDMKYVLDVAVKESNELNNVIGIPTNQIESSHWSKLKARTKHIIPYPSEEALAILNNKLKFNDLLKWKLNLPEFLPEKYHDAKDLKLPLVVKFYPESSTDSRGVRIISTMNSFESTMKQFRRNDTNGILLQEAIESTIEYEYAFVAFNGKLLSINQCLEFEHKSPLTTISKLSRNMSEVRCSTLPHWNDLNRVANKIVVETKFDGAGCLDYKISPVDNKIKIIDFNSYVCRSLFRDKVGLAKVAIFIKSWWYSYLYAEAVKSVGDEHSG